MDEKEKLIYRMTYGNVILTEKDFYTPSDDRVLQSYIEDVDGGDNFADYAHYIFDLYEEEDWYED